MKMDQPKIGQPSAPLQQEENYTDASICKRRPERGFDRCADCKSVHLTGGASGHERGQSMIEYVVVCGAIALVLGIGMIDSHSPLWLLIDAFQSAYRNFSYAISLPT